MAESLIIVESPTKIKTLKKFLGPEYAVTASDGHIATVEFGKLAGGSQAGYPTKQNRLKH